MISRRGLLGLGGVVVLDGCAAMPGSPASVDVVDQWHGTYLNNGGQPLPEITLTNQHGQPYQLANDPHTTAVALFFGYTNCPDVCPGIMADMATAKRRLPGQLVDDMTLIVVTTDPARDTPEVLGDYLSRIDESFIGLTGDLDEIVAAAKTLGVDIAEGKKLPSGGYEVDHGSYVLGFGSDRLLRVVWNGLSPAQMREDYERLLASK